jgi:hypothetical protein
MVVVILCNSPTRSKKKKKHSALDLDIDWWHCVSNDVARFMNEMFFTALLVAKANTCC